MRIARLIVVSLLFSGCFNPDIPSGAQRCSPAPDEKCAEGYFCAPDKRCYKTGVDPVCAPACGDKMRCDVKVFPHVCVECLDDGDCDPGKLCNVATHTCNVVLRSALVF